MTQYASHQIQLPRRINDLAREQARSLELTKEQYLSQLARELAATLPADSSGDPDFVTTRVLMSDDVWEQISTWSRGEGLGPSAALALQVRALDADTVTA